LMIAEDIGCNDYLTKPKAVGGADFASQWEVNLPQLLKQVFDSTDDNYRNISSLCEELIRKYNNDAFQRVIYSNSHDSAANGGARLNEEISPGNAGSVYARKRSLMAAAMVLTAPGIPMLLQGQEFMQGGSFNDWQALEWDKNSRYSGIVLAHKHLIALRRNLYGISAGLSGQSMTILHLNDEAKVLAYHRWENGGPGDDVIVVFNFTNHQQTNYYINFPRKGRWVVRFNSSWKGYSPDFKPKEIEAVDVTDETGSLDLAPYSVLILSQEP
jgi:1,4-alpha-glucan branching enzyme